MQKEGVKVSLAVATVSLVLALIFNWLVWDSGPGLGLSAFIGCLIAGFVGLALYARSSIPTDVYWLLGLLAVFAVLISVRANMLLMGMNVLACILIMLITIEAYTRGGIRDLRPIEYLARLFPPFHWIDPLIKTCADVLSARTTLRSENATAIIRGILITIPVLAIFGALFSSADPVFGKLFSDVFALNISEEMVARLIISSILVVILIAGYSYTFTAKPRPITLALPRWLSRTESIILFGSINALFLAFIVIQITYFFGGDTNISVAGMTYAEYARRGFFELLAIAALSYVLLVVAESLVKRDSDENSMAFQILGTITVLQVGIIMISSFMRLSLYEEAYGFTTLRLYSHAFILFLAALFGVLLYKILFDAREHAFALRTFLVIAVFVVAMNAWNPDAFIASKNLARYESTGKLDAEYLGRLSPDAAGVLVRIFDLSSGVDKTVLGSALYRMSTEKADQWQSWNWARSAAALQLETRARDLSDYRDTLEIASPID